MPKKDIEFSEIIRIRMRKDQLDWLNSKASKHTNRLGRSVSLSNVVRALINREMDKELVLELKEDA